MTGNAFDRLARAAERIDKWEREVERAARDVERYRRADKVRDAERRGAAAERRLREAQRAYKDAERAVLKPTRPAKRKQPAKRAPQRAAKRTPKPAPRREPAPRKRPAKRAAKKAPTRGRRSFEVVIAVDYKGKKKGHRVMLEIRLRFFDRAEAPTRTEVLAVLQEIQATHRAPNGVVFASINWQRPDARGSTRGWHTQIDAMHLDAWGKVLGRTLPFARVGVEEREELSREVDYDDEAERAGEE